MPELEPPSVKIEPDLGPVEVEFVIGQAQFGKYAVELYNKDMALLWRQSGVNTDEILDRFPLPAMNAVFAPYWLTWGISVIAFSGDPGQLYSAKVTLTQAGSSISGGEFSYQGQFQGSIPLDGFVRIDIA